MFPSYILSQFLIYLLQSSLPASLLICLLELTFRLPGNSGSPGAVPWLAASASLGTLLETPIPRLLPQPSRWFRCLLKLDPLRSVWAPGSQDPPVFTLHSCPAEPNVEQGLNKPSLNSDNTFLLLVAHVWTASWLKGAKQTNKTPKPIFTSFLKTF